MNRHLLILALTLCNAGAATAQDSIAITKAEAAAMIGTASLRRVSVHDPSIVWDATSSTYYIFGTHRGAARSKDLMNWTTFTAPWATVKADGSLVSGAASNVAFTTPQVKSVSIGGQQVAMPAFDAQAWAATQSSSYDISGNLWAPDVIYNPVMQKWCMYFSVNGDNWASSIVLLTSDNAEGPYVYQAPVVISGFRNSADAAISYTKTDLPLVLPGITSLPERYNKNDAWGTYWPNNIDPCVFYDENGKLWMSYGSWSGGIWMLELDETTGLRDYNVTYADGYATQGASCTKDPYFGKRIAGGYYVSGEGSYIEHIGDYYYLFMTYGGLSSTGGYEMRIFRSANPDGPYVDALGRNAQFTSYALNFGPSSDTRGEKLLGSYAKWGNMTDGELSQGHCSVLHHTDGRTYLVYHTRFQNGGEGHQVRVHQLFVNDQGWLVAAPFEYTGETLTDADIASTQTYTTDDVAGNYQLLVHRYRMDHANKETVTPLNVTLSANGKVTGDKTGTWKLIDGTAYVQLTLSGVIYYGVVADQQLEPTTVKAIGISAAASSGENIWAYRVRDDYQLAQQINSLSLPVSNLQTVSKSTDLYNIALPDSFQLQWSSDAPGILSDAGQYNPEGLTTDSLVNLTVRIACGRYYYTQTIPVRVHPTTQPAGNYEAGIAAYYDFDDTPVLNRYNAAEEALLQRKLTGTRPVLMAGGVRNGQVVSVSEGKNRFESYVQAPNPFRGAALEQGVSVSFWTRRSSTDDLAAAFSFYDESTKATFALGGNGYVTFNDQTASSFELNAPDTTTNVLVPAGEWAFVTLTISPTDGLTLYVNGVRKLIERYRGTQDGARVSREADIDFRRVLTHIASCSNFYLGLGTGYGSAAASYDDLLLHGRVLAADDVRALSALANRVFNFNPEAVGIDALPAATTQPARRGIYTLQGVRLDRRPARGLYIEDGQKRLAR